MNNWIGTLIVLQGRIDFETIMFSILLEDIHPFYKKLEFQLWNSADEEKEMKITKAYFSHWNYKVVYSLL